MPAGIDSPGDADATPGVRAEPLLLPTQVQATDAVRASSVASSSRPAGTIQAISKPSPSGSGAYTDFVAP